MLWHPVHGTKKKTKLLCFRRLFVIIEVQSNSTLLTKKAQPLSGLRKPDYQVTASYVKGKYEITRRLQSDYRTITGDYSWLLCVITDDYRRLLAITKRLQVLLFHKCCHIGMGRPFSEDLKWRMVYLHLDDDVLVNFYTWVIREYAEY